MMYSSATTYSFVQQLSISSVFWEGPVIVMFPKEEYNPWQNEF